MRAETLVRRIAEAHSEDEIARTFVTGMPGLFDINHLSCVPLARGVTAFGRLRGWHRDFPYQVILDAVSSLWSGLGSELVDLEPVLRNTGSLIVWSERFASDRIRQLPTFHHLVRRFGLEHFAMIALGSGDSPLWLIVLSRGSEQHPYASWEIELIERMCSQVEQASLSLRRQREEQSNIEMILYALGQTIPVSAALFDGKGRLLWLSQKALERFETTRLGQAVLIRPGSTVLESMRKAARIAETYAEDEAPNEHLYPLELVSRGEKLMVKTFRASPGASPLFLVSITRIEPTNGQSPITKDELLELGLSSREADVAILAVQGYTNPNIAARIDVKDTTVSTFLRRIYRKLRIGNRSELTFALLYGTLRGRNARDFADSEKRG